MKVPLVDLSGQLEQIGRDLKQAVDEVIHSSRYVGGPKVEALEEAVAGYVGTRFAIGCSSGTDALLASLMALEIGPGDLVVTTAYSFFATAGVVARLQATPVFVDIDPETYNICPRSLTDWCDRNADKLGTVKAILPVHLYGQCADMDALVELADSIDVPLVEDAAQAMGARYPSAHGPKRAGSIGALGCFSFFPTKNLGGIGDGGMVTTDDEALARRIRHLRSHGANPKYHHSLVGGNFRLDALQAAALLVKLPHLEEWNANRQRNARRYDEEFAGSHAIAPKGRWERSDHVYHQYVISLPERRDELRTFLQENGVETEVYYPVPSHLQECFRGLGYKLGDLARSEHASAHTLALPIYPELTEEMQHYVVSKVLEFYG